MLRAFRLRLVLFFLILLAGLVPLAISTGVLIQPNRDLLRTQEQTDLTRLAESLSRDVDVYIAGARRELELIGEALLAAPQTADGEDFLQQPWVTSFLQGVARRHPDWLRFAVLDDQGRGPQFTSLESTAALQLSLRRSFEEALAVGRPSFGFVEVGPDDTAAVVITVPASGPVVPASPATEPDGVPAAVRRIVLEVVVQPQRLLDDLARSASGTDGGSTFLIDRQGELIWSSVDSEEEQEVLLESPIVRSFVARPLPLTEIYALEVGGESRRLIGIVSPIEETGWGVVAHRPESTAFMSVRRLLFTALISSLLLVLLALALAYVASSWIGQPIQRLAQTSRAMARGDFSSRVDTGGLGFELKGLAEDFNLMGGYIEGYVEKLQQAAQANRELFIGSLRAFTAAIDAKDPYTRGHSERVASAARIIAKNLGLSEDVQGRLWIAALLHDVGKIGVEDRILKKGGVLSKEEYEQMKRHTVIGAEIMAPIDQLKGAIPVIRWHHENWNGKGYPDGLKGEQIPLMARIVAVADTFDAITTNRPYQDAYTLEYAVETITKLTGSRFDAKVVTSFLRSVEAGEIRIRQPQAGVPDAAVMAAAGAK